jgi:hypothetical protein
MTLLLAIARAFKIQPVTIDLMTDYVSPYATAQNARARYSYNNAAHDGEVQYQARLEARRLEREQGYGR